MVVPGPARRHIDLEADVAAKASALGDAGGFCGFYHLYDPGTAERNVSAVILYQDFAAAVIADAILDKRESSCPIPLCHPATSPSSPEAPPE
jgi:hypothetical protein